MHNDIRLGTIQLPVAWNWQIYAPGRTIDKTDGRTAILSLLTVKTQRKWEFGE